MLRGCYEETAFVELHLYRVVVLIVLLAAFVDSILSVEFSHCRRIRLIYRLISYTRVHDNYIV